MTWRRNPKTAVLFIFFICKLIYPVYLFFALGSMDEQSGHENPMRLMPFTFGESLCGVSQNVPVLDTLTSPQRVYCQQTSRDYVEFLPESSSSVRQAPSSDIPQSIALPASSMLHNVSAVSEMKRQVLHNNLGKTLEFEPAEFSFHMDAWKVKPSIHSPRSNNHEASVARDLRSYQKQIIDWDSLNVLMDSYLSPQNVGEPARTFTSTQIPSQNHTLRTQELAEDNCSVHHPHSRRTVTQWALSYPHKAKSMSRKRAAVTDRERRMRISQKLEALEQLLPSSKEVGRTAVIEEIIEHIKYLQLQLKDLSQSRLGGESTWNPFIFLEGRGHYLLHEQMTNEPLEEMMGRLLEVNPSEATKLLESRGLSVMPMALAEGLPRAI